MNLVDSCGWLEYFADGPLAEFFASALRETDELVVPSIVILEVFKRVLQQRGEAEALVAAAAMMRGRVAGLDGAVAMEAARLGVSLGLPLADSVILATARAHGATVWTSDSDFEGIEGVRYAEARKRKKKK
ncbi:MAG: type II toxin-antitoxin system VapC family toxin [Candidatus Nitrospinota bacterium M3_3B_026]